MAKKKTTKKKVAKKATRKKRAAKKAARKKKPDSNPGTERKQSSFEQISSESPKTTRSVDDQKTQTKSLRTSITQGDNMTQQDRFSQLSAAQGGGGSEMQSNFGFMSEMDSDDLVHALAAAFASTNFTLDDFVEAQNAIEAEYFANEDDISSFATQPTNDAQLMKMNVLGTAIGDKESGDGLTGDMAIRIYVNQKLPESQLGGLKIRPEIGGIPTDVVEVGNVAALMPSISMLNFQRRASIPRSGSNRDGGTRGGSSIGRTGIGWGTFGCLCARDGKLFILSNNHVLDNTNSGSPKDAIIQPGSRHGGRNPQDKIAELAHSVGINMGQNANNKIDAALAQTDFRFVNENHHTYTNTARPVNAAPRLQVKKEGATTGLTFGRVMAVNANVVVDYGQHGVARFTGQIEISGTSGTFSKRGDSGSLIVTDPGNDPVGLLFSGSESRNLTWANPIQSVMDRLQIQKLVNQFE